LVLDTETTGLGNSYEIIELAVVNPEGEVLFQSLIKPTVPVYEGARKVHQITDDMLANATSFAKVLGAAVSDHQGEEHSHLQ
jgi:DNA polymerase III epsilon subunit-like protein